MTQPTNLNHNLSVAWPFIYTHIRPNTPSTVSNKVTSFMHIYSTAEFEVLFRSTVRCYYIVSCLCILFYYRTGSKQLLNWKLHPGVFTLNLMVPIYVVFLTVTGRENKLFFLPPVPYSHVASWAALSDWHSSQRTLLRWWIWTMNSVNHNSSSSSNALWVFEQCIAFVWLVSDWASIHTQ